MTNDAPILINEELQKCYERLDQLCGTPNIYRQFDDKYNDQPIKTPHQLATFIYKHFKENKNIYCLKLEFDKATITDLLNQTKKENRLFHKIRDSYLHDHSTVCRHNFKALFYHFDRILKPDKSSINGLSLNYITVLFAPIIISVKVNDESNPVLKAAIQTAIFQTIFHQIGGFFNNIDRTNQINPVLKGKILVSDHLYNVEMNDDVYYFPSKYKENGKEKDDDWWIVKSAKGIGICPKKYVQPSTSIGPQQTETTSKSDLSEENIQQFHDYY